MIFLFSWEPIYPMFPEGSYSAKRLEWSRGPRSKKIVEIMEKSHGIQTWMRTPFYDHNIHDTDNFTVSAYVYIIIYIYITITCIVLKDQYIYIYHHYKTPSIYIYIRIYIIIYHQYI